MKGGLDPTTQPGLVVTARLSTLSPGAGSPSLFIEEAPSLGDPACLSCPLPQSSPMSTAMHLCLGAWRHAQKPECLPSDLKGILVSLFHSG